MIIEKGVIITNRQLWQKEINKYFMPPHITEYLEFVNDKSLFIYMKNGDIILDPKMSTSLGKLYIYIYWNKYIKLGNSPSTLWNVMSAIKNDADPIRFDKHGYQINKREMLDLESSYFLGVMAEEYLNKYWFSYLKIIIYILFICLGVFFVKKIQLIDKAWAQLFEISKINQFL